MAKQTKTQTKYAVISIRKSDGKETIIATHRHESDAIAQVKFANYCKTGGRGTEYVWRAVLVAK